jgi:hypothetical protein
VRNALIMLMAAVVVVELAYLVYQRQRESAPQAPAEVLQQIGHTAESTAKPHQNPKLGNELLRGTVRNGAGLPEAGCRVIVAQAVAPRMLLARNVRIPRWFQTTDASGNFEVNSLPEGDFLVMALSESAHDARMVRVEHAGAVAEVVLRLRPSRRVSGYVYGVAGRPATAARVFAVETGAGATGVYAHLPAIATAGGRFSLSYLPEGPCRLLAVAEGEGSALSEILPPDQPAVNIALSEGPALGGTVESLEDGRPLPNVKLLFTEQGYGIETFSVVSDASGRFRVGPLRPGQYRVEAAPGRYVLSQGIQTLSLPQEGEIALRLVPAGYLRGRVLEADGRRGVPRVRVTAEAVERPAATQSVLSDNSGYYRIEGLYAGRYRVRAETSDGAGFRGDADSTEAIVSPGREAKGPDFRRMAGRRMEGTVVDAAGAPMSGANVRVDAGGRPRGTRSGAEGRFVLENVSIEGMVRIRASVLDRVSVWYALTQQDLDSGALTLTLAHTANCAIHGVAVNAQGEPVAEAYLRCMAPDDTLFTRADARGAFSFEDLIPGEYHVAAGITEAQAREADPQSHLRLEKGQRLGEVRVVLP